MNLYVVLGPSFHGATLLALLLNNHARLSSLGDGIPRRTYDQKCACQKLVSQCEFWQQIEKKSDMQRFADLDYLLPVYPRIFRHKSLNKVLNKGMGLLSVYVNPKVWKLLGPIGHEYVRIYLEFYETVCALQGTEIFVEGSKNLVEVLVLKGFTPPEHTLNILHLTRDPRGYFNSLKKYYPHTTPGSAATKWKRYHSIVEKLRQSLEPFNYFFLRYEDLCQEPVAQMQQVFEFLQVESQHVCQAPVNPRKHHLMGNKMIFQFDGTIKLDNAWKTRISDDDQRRLLALAQPLSSHFGYS